MALLTLYAKKGRENDSERKERGKEVIIPVMNENWSGNLRKKTPASPVSG